ncbi:membrane protein containing TM2 domain protein [Candidatus Magnetomorum sp. HK-1]|nr:membrane protein containing TM2 domain protein [Candidatus Magnetomorum sp. HK-1]
MSQEKYRVIFKGKISESANQDEVKKKLAKILKMTDEKAEKLFSGKPIIIKKNADLEACKKIKAVFKKAGAVCAVKKQAAPKEEKAPEFVAPSLPGKITLQKKAVELPGKPAKKSTVIMLGLFLGGFGFHKFYTSRNFMGYLYLLLCWSGVSYVFALLDCLIYLFIKKENFGKKYRVLGNKKHIVLAFLMGTALIGAEIYLGITIGVPKYVEYRDRALHLAVDHELNHFWIMQEVYYLDHNRYALSMEELKYKPKYPEIILKLSEAKKECFKAKGKHPKLNYPRTIDCQGKIEDGFEL